MVAKEGGYYGSEFQGSRNVMQGESLYLTIVNLAVDAVVQHWVKVMGERAEERSRRKEEVRHQNSLFYADDGMVASSDPRCIQGAFITLEGIFERVGLKTNFGKAVGMVCLP